jgi:starch synthase
MFAMRYGTIPVVTDTGGLKDTVISYLVGGTGIPFALAQEQELEEALEQALILFDDDGLKKQVIKRCVQQDFSWEHAMEKYKSAYIKLLN